MKIGMFLREARGAQKQLSLAKSVGFEAIELWPEGGLQDPKAAKELKPLLSEFDLTAHFPLHLYATSLLFGSKAFMKRRMGLHYLVGGLDVLHDLGVRLYTIHAGRQYCPIEELAMLRDECEKRGIRMNIENGTGKGQFGEIEKIKQLAKALKVDITLDIGHAFGAKQDIFDLSGIRDMITHIHLHDADQKTDHLGLGTGLLPLAKVITTLKKIKYDETIVLELGHDPHYEEALVKSKKVLESLWTKL